MKKIQILVGDDHLIVRDGLAALLAREPDLEVLARVSDGDEALDRIVALRPDVAVLDVAMPRMTGIEVARKLRDLGLETAVVLLSVHGEPAYVRAALAAGASGYVVKAAASDELLIAVRAAAARDLYLSPAVSRGALAEPASPGADAEPLNAGERDVLRLLAQGQTSKEIAATLGLNVRTVDARRAAIMDKLGIRNIPGLVKYAIRQHLTTLDDGAEATAAPRAS